MADQCVAHMRQPHGHVNGTGKESADVGLCRLWSAEADLHCPMEMTESQGPGGLIAKHLVTLSRLR